MWRARLLRFNPGSPAPLAVIDSAELETAAGVSAKPPELAALNGTVMWGSRALAFSAYPPETAPSSDANIIGELVGGYRVKRLSLSGIEYESVYAAVEGVLTLLPTTSNDPIGETP